MRLRTTSSGAVSLVAAATAAVLAADGCAGGLSGSRTAPPSVPSSVPSSVLATPSASVATGHASVGALRVDGAFMPAPAPPDVAAAYFAVHNSGSSAGALTSVSSPVSPAVGLHHYVDRPNGTQQMVALARLAVPAHGSASLHVAGPHVMVMRPRDSLKQGQRVTLTLTFAHAGRVRLSVPVVSPAGPEDQGDASMAPMPGMGS